LFGIHLVSKNLSTISQAAKALPVPRRPSRVVSFDFTEMKALPHGMCIALLFDLFASTTPLVLVLEKCFRASFCNNIVFLHSPICTKNENVFTCMSLAIFTPTPGITLGTLNRTEASLKSAVKFGDPNPGISMSSDSYLRVQNPLSVRADQKVNSYAHLLLLILLMLSMIISNCFFIILLHFGNSFHCDCSAL
jgi:hypothetical protein